MVRGNRRAKTECVMVCTSSSRRSFRQFACKSVVFNHRESFICFALGRSWVTEVLGDFSKLKLFPFGKEKSFKARHDGRNGRWRIYIRRVHLSRSNKVLDDFQSSNHFHLAKKNRSRRGTTGKMDDGEYTFVEFICHGVTKHWAIFQSQKGSPPRR